MLSNPFLNVCMLVMKTEFNKNLILICFSIAYHDENLRPTLMKIVADLTTISATLLELSAEY